MTMGMVEKVARELEPWLWRDIDSGDEHLRESSLNYAKRAIAAMREPTEGMKFVFDRDFSDWYDEKISDPYHLYTVMIDAALNESEVE